MAQTRSTFVAALPGARVGERVELPGGVPAEVLELRAEGALVALLGRGEPVGPARLLGQLRGAPTGESLLGRCLSPSGAPLDGGAPPTPVAWRSLAERRRRVGDQPWAQAYVPTGQRAVDLLAPLGSGEARLLLGPPGAGKRRLGLAALAHHAKHAGPSVLAAVGWSGAELAAACERLRAEGALARTIVFAASPAEPPLARLRVTEVACAAAEALAESGQSVLLLVDDLGRHLASGAELATELGRPVHDTAWRQAVLLDRAGLWARGALTILAALEGESPAPVWSACGDRWPAVLPLRDGCVDLERMPVPVSKFGPAGLPRGLRRLAGRLGMELARDRELRPFVARAGPVDLDASSRAALRRGAALRAYLSSGEPRSAQTMCVELAALHEGLLDDLPEVEPVLARAVAAVQTREPALWAGLPTQLSDADTPRLRAAIQASRER